MNPPLSVVPRTVTPTASAHVEQQLLAHHDDVDPRDLVVAREPEHVAVGGPA